MDRWYDRLNLWLGRLVFRFFGLLCGAVALACAYSAWWQIEHWNPQYGWIPVILFGLAAIAAASCVPYCFSRRRGFVEALDAMEGGVADQPRRP